MKRLLLLFVLVSGIINAQIVDIPDPYFKEALTTGFEKDLDGNVVRIDANEDGEIQISEAIAISELSVDGLQIADLSGIEAFINLRKLNCSSNQLSSLNISQNTNLTKLNCSINSITALDVSQNVNLTSLQIILNEISYIDLSQNTKLTGLQCGANKISNIDLSQNTNLTSLACERNDLTTLDLSNNTKLNYLFCGLNNIMTLDVSENTNLSSLICFENNLTSLDVSQSINLENLNCGANNLTALDVSQNVNLTGLTCWHNNLTTLDVSHNINLEGLVCNSNNLATLDVSQNINLIKLWCNSVNLTTLDVSENANLTDLDCGINNLTSLNLSQNTKLNSLVCNENQLTSIVIKNGIKEKFLFFSNNPNLQYICADEEQLDEVQTIAGEDVVVNSYCSFNPGGNYNSITGLISIDDDSNGCDAKDLIPSNVKIRIDDGTNQDVAFTNTLGNYTFFTDVGDFDISLDIENPSWFSVSPSTANIIFADSNNNNTTQDFCLTPNGTHNDLEVLIAPIEAARPGFDAVYQIVFKNKGNQELSGEVNFSYDDTVLDFISSSIVADSQSMGQLSWNYTNLEPFESRVIEITVNVNSPMEIPAVNNGDTLNFSVNIIPNAGDETPLDNMFTYEQVVVGSYDPNDITCLEGNEVSPEKIGEYLHYLINFENTGTAAATFIVVKDVLDISQYDLSSLQILSASHEMTARITDNNLEFIFDNINLEAEGKGNIIFKIKTKSTLLKGDSVNNKADIYFDYNFPIETNIASTLFQETLSTQEKKIDGSIYVFPNPSKQVIHVEAKADLNLIEMYDFQGRLVLRKNVVGKDNLIPITSLSKGTYLLKIQTNTGQKLKRIIKN